MESRRSVRSRKTVDYTKFSCEDSEDDDFQSSSSPPNKKPKQERTAKKEGKQSLKLSGNKRNATEPSKSNDDAKADIAEEKPNNTGRLPVTEKVFQRELQTALELSKTELIEEKENVENMTEKKQSKGNEKKAKGDGEESASAETADANDSDFKESDTEESASESEDLSDWSEESPPKKTQKTKAAMKEKTNGKTTSKEPAKKQPEAAVVTKKQPARSEAKSVRATKSAPKSWQTKPQTSISRVSTASSPSTVHGLVKPANLPAVGLRLGLSRKAPVKPLHPSLKVQP